MKTKITSILIVILCTFLTSFGQLFEKLGANQLSFNLLSIITNWYLYIGVILYVLGAVLLITALKGGELSVLYPFIATSFIWVSFISMIFLREMMNTWKWLGIFIIIGGITLVGLGRKK